MKFKLGQEEMVGFALIIIIVAVILLVFLGLSLSRPGKEAVESYEVDNFIQAFLEYTSDCENGIEYLPVQELISGCNGKGVCDDSRDVCEVLNITLKNIVEKSWRVGTETPIKAYKLKISAGQEIFLIADGNETNSYESGLQSFSKGGTDYEVVFTAYY